MGPKDRWSKLVFQKYFSHDNGSIYLTVKLTFLWVVWLLIRAKHMGSMVLHLKHSRYYWMSELFYESITYMCKPIIFYY